MEIKEKTDAADVSIVAIGSSTPKQAKKFINKFSFGCEVYCDPSLKAFQAFELERGFFKTLGPSSLIKGVGTLRKGFRQGLSAGDLWQQGGLFVIGPGASIHFAHQNKVAGDQADLSAVLTACLGKKR